MSHIKKIVITYFRNLEHVELNLVSGYNFFFGKNGAGKTSLVESIYYASHGRSFRSSQYQNLVMHNKPSFTLHIKAEHQAEEVALGLSKAIDGTKVVRVNQNSGIKTSEFVRYLPSVLLSSCSYQFYTDGSRVRRQFLDWLTFHVEQKFAPAWRDYQKLLLQRNKALKLRLPNREVQIWDESLVACADIIHKSREKWLEALKPVATQYFTKLLPDFAIDCCYTSGWNGGDLRNELTANLQKDYQLGYTELGPHKADFWLSAGEHSAADCLSQGQQKIAIFGLQLAMGEVLAIEQGNTPIFLLDDLASELDKENRQRIIAELGRLGAQVIVTGIEEAELRDCIHQTAPKLFHVEHGAVSVVEHPRVAPLAGALL